MKTDWRKIDAEELRGRCSRRVKLDGVETELSPSPYDIPQALRAFVSEDKAHVVVELQYLSEDEEYERICPTDNVEFEIGMESGRIKRVFFSIAGLRKQMGEVNLESAVRAAFITAQEHFVHDIAERETSVGFRSDIYRTVLANRSTSLFSAPVNLGEWRGRPEPAADFSGEI